jgi:hypothetical protein
MTHDFRRRTWIIAAASLAALLVAGSAGAALWHHDTGTDRTRTEPSAATAKVTRTDLSTTRTVDGTLGYGTATTLRSAGGGVITWLPSSGRKVTRGKALYRVDDRPIPLFYGGIPLYRKLATPNTVGRDVRILADNLRALGYSIGSQPRPGQTVTVRPPAPIADPTADDPPTTAPTTAPTTGARPTKGSASSVQVKVRPGDAVLTRGVINAVKRWQTALGMPPTGVVEAYDVAVHSGPVRIDSVQAQVGAPADGPLLKATPTGKAVTVPMDPTEASGIRSGRRVTVHLPDETTVRGRVASVSTSAEPAEGEQNDGATQIAVTVKLDNPAKAGKFDAAPVRVDFVGETRRQVLAVPVTALLALREGGYGVQLAGGRLIAVTTGLFATGQVEVSGEGLADGDLVVVAS